MSPARTGCTHCPSPARRSTSVARTTRTSSTSALRPSPSTTAQPSRNCVRAACTSYACSARTPRYTIMIKRAMSPDLENFIEELQAYRDPRGAEFQATLDRWVASTENALRLVDETANFDADHIEPLDEIR